MLKKILFAVDNVLQKFFKIKISLVKQGSGHESDRYGYQRKHINFNIKKEDNVLDIGSGGDPFPLATHIADFFPQETTHRAEKLVKDSRPFYKCDVQKMPFGKKEFDFVYCAHVLEHVDDPAKACEEIMRVGKRGYIETPTKTSDIMFNFLKMKDHHRWFIVLIGNSLIFFEYNEKERKDTGVNDFYTFFHSEYKNPFQELMKNNRRLFDNMFLWEDKFFYYVFNKHGNLISTNKK